MARIKHIALTTRQPAQVADFYKSAFGLTELRRSPNGAVFLSDGHLNLAILNTKGEEAADMGAHGPHFTGIHHFGFEVDDLDAACQQLEGAHAERLTGKDHVDRTMAAGGHANFEMKWSGPDGVVIDISHTGWEGTDGERDTAGATRIKHIALTTKEPAKVAEFYKSAFGLKELRRNANGCVFLTEGHIHLAILNTKGEESADMGAHGPHFVGIHHFGFEVDDLGEAGHKLEAVQGQRLSRKEATDAALRDGLHANFEQKWSGPDGVVIDVSHTGWEGTA